jgi:ComF family protein
VAIDDPRCLCCGAPTVREIDACSECRGRGLAFDRAWSAFSYAGVARDVVTALKASGAPGLAGLMADELAARAPEGLLQGALVPVPAHRRRRRRHGFNQAQLLARALGRASSMPARDGLRRVEVPAQVGLERLARLHNARGSVRLRTGASAPRRAVLVDDVYTTGATLDACAQALRAAGTREVAAITFARAIRGVGIP